MRALTLATVLAASARAAPPTDCSYTSLSPSKTFGVGGRNTQGYADRELECWRIRGDAHVTLVFDFFETERDYDLLSIYDGDERVDLSVELVAPTVYRSKTKELKLVFKSDENSPATPKTMERGFEASYFDSSDGSCANACSGQGRCVEGVCQCQSTRAGDDCSVPLIALVRDQGVLVQDLKVSQWPYAQYTFDEAGAYAIEVIDTGPSDSEPKLVVRKGSMPTRETTTPRTALRASVGVRRPSSPCERRGMAFCENDRSPDPRADDFSDIHVVRGTAQAGDVLYVGVVNDDVAHAKEDAKFTIAVRVAHATAKPGFTARPALWHAQRATMARPVQAMASASWPRVLICATGRTRRGASGASRTTSAAPATTVLRAACAAQRPSAAATT